MQLSRPLVVAAQHRDSTQPRQLERNLGGQPEFLGHAQTVAVDALRRLVVAADLGQAARDIAGLQLAPPLADFVEQRGSAGGVALGRDEIAR